MRRATSAKRCKTAPESTASPFWLTESLKIFKTQAAFAEALGVEAGTVTNWKRRGVPIPQCKQIAQVTKGRVPAHKVRPDFFDGIAA